MSCRERIAIEPGIASGESAPGARPMEKSWPADIRDQCLRARVPFFFKQWRGVIKNRAGRTLDGRTWDGEPAAPAPMHDVPPVGANNYSPLQSRTDYKP